MTGINSHSSSTANPFSSHNVVGVHYRVGKKIGEGSFGIIYEGEMTLLSFLLLSSDDPAHPS